MEKDTLIKIRKELHSLPGKERGQRLPIRILGPNSNFNISEAEACFLWDDDNEIVYIVCSNTIPTSSIDNRLYPMKIMTLSYSDITFMSVPVDRLSLDNFLKDKVEKGLTNEETRKRYFNDMTKLFEDSTYLMGQPSPTTEKRGMRPDDEIMDKDATKFL